VDLVDDDASRLQVREDDSLPVLDDVEVDEEPVCPIELTHVSRARGERLDLQAIVLPGITLLRAPGVRSCEWPNDEALLLQEAIKPQRLQ
jgi:hypothetical protein